MVHIFYACTASFIWSNKNLQSHWKLHAEQTYSFHVFIPIKMHATDSALIIA